MKQSIALRQLDDLLRGRFTRDTNAREGIARLPTRTLLIAAPILGAIYGVFMGLYGLARPDNASLAQWSVTILKVPLLFLLTLAVTYPSLYVFSALSDSALRPVQTLRLLLAAICVNLAFLASLGPVTGFFTMSTDSYAFMVLLNVLFFAAAGITGLWFLQRALHSVFGPEPPATIAPMPGPQLVPSGDGDAAADPPADDAGTQKSATLIPSYPSTRRTARSTLVFRVWIVIYGLVGAQMGWILRPFIGAPELPFELFRDRQSNFFAAFLRSLEALLS